MPLYDLSCSKCDHAMSDVAGKYEEVKNTKCTKCGNIMSIVLQPIKYYTIYGDNAASTTPKGKGKTLKKGVKIE